MASDNQSNAPELTVSELSGALKRSVEDAFGHVRVRGELSGVKRAASGHLYLCLKDESAVLDGVKAPLWPLEKELELVDMLFELHLLRDKALFTLERSVPSPLPKVQLPPMSLVSLAENAMKHGPGAGHRGALQLTVREEAGQLLFVLENPGAFRGPREGSEGLPSLRRQLELTYGGRAAIVVEAAGASRTRATLRVPTETA